MENTLLNAAQGSDIFGILGQGLSLFSMYLAMLGALATSFPFLSVFIVLLVAGLAVILLLFPAKGILCVFWILLLTLAIMPHVYNFMGLGG